MSDLRGYQRKAIENTLQAIQDGHSRVLLQSPAGSGKTRMAVELARRLPSPCLFLAHTREIVHQAGRAFQNEGAQVDWLTAKTHTSAVMPRMIRSSITIASQQTAWSRAVKRGHYIAGYKLIIADEAHHARARTWQDIFNLWPDAILIGLTATPCRGDGRGLGNIFDKLIQGVSYRELINEGHLVDAPDTKIWTWPFDTKGIAVAKGDYVIGGEKGAARKLNTAKRVGDCVEHWLALAKGRPSIVYAQSVAHAHNIADRFNSVGVKAACIEADTPKDVRDNLTAKLGTGELTIIANYGTLTEGFDCPAVSCIILERITKQVGTYIQMSVRGLRPAPNKQDCIILDHVGMVQEHGRPTMARAWELSTDKLATRPIAESYSSKDKVKGCPKCHVLMTQPPCQGCGYEPAPLPKKGEMEKTARLNLMRLSDQKFAHVEKILTDPRQAEYKRLRGMAAWKKWKPNAAAVIFKKRYQEWPNPLWDLPDPRSVAPSDFLIAAKRLGHARGFKPGWEQHQFRNVYGEYPNVSF